MKVHNLLGLIAGIAGLAAAQAGAQQPGGGLLVSPPPRPPSIVHRVPGFSQGFVPGFVVVEREYVPVIEREIIREVPAEPVAPPAPPPPPRKPFVVGRSYSSLPGGCMKMIEGGATYFHCSGDWYRQVGAGQYKAVSPPL